MSAAYDIYRASVAAAQVQLDADKRQATIDALNQTTSAGSIYNDD
jgi:hypothetical protein